MAPYDETPDPAYYINIDDMTLWADNYNEGDVGAIVESIRKYGFWETFKLHSERDEIKAGNHTLLALRHLKAEKKWAPRGEVVEHEGDWYVRYLRLDLDPLSADGFAVAHNRTAARANPDNTALLNLLTDLEKRDSGLRVAAGYDDDDMEYLQSIVDDDFQDLDQEASDDSLLRLVDITIADPSHDVAVGDVWLLDSHVLICGDVVSDWPLWVPYLDSPEALFAPYPGVFVPQSERAEGRKLVMVQPDVYICGHILDRYAEVNGQASVKQKD